MYTYYKCNYIIEMDPPSVGLLIHGVSQQQKYLNIPCVCTEHVSMSLFKNATLYIALRLL